MQPLNGQQGTGEVWRVSDLNREVRTLLENGFGTVWVEAEISNLARPASGHLYFSLKDPSAQLRAAFFRQRQRGSVRDLANGDQVLVRGRLSLYEPRGDYQLIVEHLEPAGEGALRLAFEQLKRKLAAEGLFSSDRKRSIPTFPRRIGVVTSSSGAAVRDVLKVLRRRMPSIPVLVFPSSVQGQAAPRELTQAVRRADARADCDVLLLVRGGGSMEDLAAFNDEALARAISDCTTPIISGVGHETDTTIADFVADLAAPTPSAAAELATPDGEALTRALEGLRQRLGRAQLRRLHQIAQRSDFLSHRLMVAGPHARVRRQQTHLGAIAARLPRALKAIWQSDQQRLRLLKAQLSAASPARRIERQRDRLNFANKSLINEQRQRLESLRASLASHARQLNAISPLATLERGYAVVRDTQGQAVHHISQIDVDDRAEVLVKGGSFDATITAVRTEDDEESVVER
ncbi:MAG: exodeoxyribonuclease VII large subunit [Pseudomonadota bacterium]